MQVEEREEFEKPHTWNREAHRYVLYCTREDCDATLIWWFSTKGAAKLFLDVLFGEDEVKFREGRLGVDEEIVTSTGIVVSGRFYRGETRAVHEHDPSLKQMVRGIDPHVRKLALYHRNPKPDATEEEVLAAGQSSRERRRSSPTARSPAGYVHVSDIALALGIEPRQARAALRSLEMEKPAYGWRFAPSDVEDVKAKIKGVIES